MLIGVQSDRQLPTPPEKAHPVTQVKVLRAKPKTKLEIEARKRLKSAFADTFKVDVTKCHFEEI